MIRETVYSFIVGALTTFVILCAIVMFVSQHTLDVLKYASDSNMSARQVYYMLYPDKYKLRYSDWERWERENARSR